MTNSIYFFRFAKKKKSLKLKNHYLSDFSNFLTFKNYYNNFSILFYQFFVLKNMLNYHERKLTFISMACMEFEKLKKKKLKFKPNYLKIKLKTLLESQWI